MVVTTAARSYQTEPLALAVVENALAPLLLLDGELRVLAASHAFCEEFAPAGAALHGRRLFEIDPVTWDVPQLRRALMQTLSGAVAEGCCEFDCASSAMDTRRLAVNTRKVRYPDSARSPLLLTITDVTDDRAIAHERQLLRQEKGALLRELVRHRTNIENLCESLGASMICTDGELTLDVLTESGALDSRLSASIGVVVADLVIQTLAQTYPHFAADWVHLAHHPAGAGWTIRVRDYIDGASADLPALAS